MITLSPVTLGVLAALVMQSGGVRPPAQAPASRPSDVRTGITIQPETVTVGDPFVVMLRVRAPRGATIAFPEGPDSLAEVEALDTRTVRAATDTPADSSAVDQTASYRLAAWDVGDQPLRFRDIVVRIEGQERHLGLGELQVHVRSVLPEDSAKRVPKPPRPPFDYPRPWWHYLIAALVALALIGFFIWWWRRRRARGRPALVPDPFKVAEEEFARVEALGLLEAGERGRFVALMVEVLRHYQSARVDGAWPSLTSTELVALVKRTRHVPVDRLAAVLAESDMIKFARRTVTTERARELAHEVRTIVRDVDASVKREAAEAAARAAVAAEAEGTTRKEAA
jgi:hypothetical protein